MPTSTRIIATARYAPARIVQNSFFSHLDADPDTWIFSRTGIRERRFATSDESTSTMATAAVSTLLADHQIDPLSIDLIVLATSTPDMTLPQTAAMVQKNIGARNAVAFDVNAKVFDSAKKLGATVVSASDEKQLNTQLEFVLQRKILLEEEEPVKKK